VTILTIFVPNNSTSGLAHIPVAKVGAASAAAIHQYPMPMNIDHWAVQVSRLGWMIFSSNPCISPPSILSGFEHVFSGEWRQPGIVDGHHNWVRFYLQEKAGDINYHGYFGHQKDDIIGTFQYKWNGFLKKIGGFFFQTSPGFSLLFITNAYFHITFPLLLFSAFDFSLFTVCALTQPGDEGCQFELLNSELFVTSFIQPCQNGKCVATTYPGSWYNTTVVN
jgi:hypothetical protein